MWKLNLWVFVLAVAVYGAAGKSLKDSHPRRSTSRIIGGYEVDITHFPHQVSLIYKGIHVCGGSIINETYVLTAAHCVVGKIMSGFKVRTGSRYWAIGGELHGVASITPHPLFNLFSGDYDVAVMKIAGRITIDGVNSKIVQLAQPGSILKNGQVMVASGWGLTDLMLHEMSYVLKAVTLPFMDTEHCQQLSPFYSITDRMICAGAPLHLDDTCEGDSGGPLIDTNFVQYGIVSFGFGGPCGYMPSVYASVPNLRQWIRENSGV